MIIVLADHECAGFSLIGALTGGINNLKALPSDSGVTDPNTQPARQKSSAHTTRLAFRSTTFSPTAIRKPST
jgi:hypothetical protein